MWQVIKFLILGIFSAALVVSAIAVYLFHHVDRPQIGQLNRAFAELCAESGGFALLVGAAVSLLTLPGSWIARLRINPPRATLGFWLGVGTVVCQYAGELLAFRYFPRFTDVYRGFYLVAAIVVCAGALLYDSYRQSKLLETFKATASAE